MSVQVHSKHEKKPPIATSKKPKKAAGVAEVQDDEAPAVHQQENFGC